MASTLRIGSDRVLASRTETTLFPKLPGGGQSSMEKRLVGFVQACHQASSKFFRGKVLLEEGQTPEEIHDGGARNTREIDHHGAGMATKRVRNRLLQPSPGAEGPAPSRKCPEKGTGLDADRAILRGILLRGRV